MLIRIKNTKSSKQGKLKVAHSYVFVVYECSEWFTTKRQTIEGKIHGVYISKEEALGKKEKLYKTPGIEGHICILKKPLQGASLL